MQWSEASEVQTGAEKASNGSIHVLLLEGSTAKDYETQTLSGSLGCCFHAMGTSPLFKERAFAFAVGGIFGPTKLQHQLTLFKMDSGGPASMAS